MLIRENDNYILAPAQSYRWISAELIGTVPALVYKDRFVMLMWENKRAVVIRNPSIAETYRKQFEFLWRLGKPLPPGTRNRIRELKKIPPSKKKG